MTSPRQKALADRATLHFHFVMASLSVGDWASANDYLVHVLYADGRAMYRSVVDMIAVGLRIPPMGQ